MEDADSSKKPVKPTGDGKEQKQKLANSVRFYWVGFIVITVVVILSRFPIPGDWVGMATSRDEKFQIATEEVVVANGKITKTTTINKNEPAKTFWDWMSLLLAPAALAGLGFVLQSSQERAKVAREELENRAEEAAKTRAAEQAQAEKDRYEDMQCDDALEAYISCISDLLVDKGLSILAKKKERGTLNNERQKDLLDTGMDVIRARTLSIFRRFTNDKNPSRTDGERKCRVLLFLYETGLIRNLREVVKTPFMEVEQFQALLSLSGADLSGAKLNGVDLSGVAFSESKLNKADLSESYLGKSYFDRANLEGANLSRADISEVYFIESDLNGAILSGANLSGAFLGSANLSGAFLDDAVICGAKLLCANLSDADLSSADLSSADLSGANLSGANLSNADFLGADLSGANLSGAIFSGTDFLGVKLSGAILLSVDLSQAKDLTLEQLEGIEPPLLCKVKLPEDIDIDPNPILRTKFEQVLSLKP